MCGESWRSQILQSPVLKCRIPQETKITHLFTFVLVRWERICTHGFSHQISHNIGGAIFTYQNNVSKIASMCQTFEHYGRQIFVQYYPAMHRKSKHMHATSCRMSFWITPNKDPYKICNAHKHALQYVENNLYHCNVVLILWILERIVTLISKYVRLVV